MSQKLLIPLGAAGLIALAVIAVWLLPSDSPLINTAKDNTAEPSADDVPPLDINPNDFKPEQHTPDPVLNERPPQPFETPKPTRRFLVSGRVVEPTGIGVSGAQIHFVGEQELRDWRGSGFTDDAGYYRVLAWAPEPRGTVADNPYGRVAAETADGAVAVSESTPIPAGDEVVFPDVVLAESRLIEGQVLTETGEPVPGAQVTARSATRVSVASLRGRQPSVTSRPYVTSVLSGADGRYSFKHMPPAEYALTVTAGYFGENQSRAIVDVNNAPSVWQDLTVELNNHIRGRVQDQGGRPVSGVVVQLRQKDGEESPTDAPEKNALRRDHKGDNTRDSVRRFDDAARLNPRGRWICVTDAAGRFGFSNHDESEFELVTRVGESETSLKAVTVNQPDFTLEVQVSTVLSGIVRDAHTGLPVESYDARLLAGEAPDEVDPFQRVAPDGRFAFHPGGLYMFANPPAQPMRLRVSAAGYTPATMNLGNLQSGETLRNMDIELKPLCDLALTLTLEGRGLDFEPVALLFDGRLAHATSTNEIGRSRVPGVAPQTYRVRLVRVDGTRLEGNLVVPARREASIEVKLARVN